MLVLLLILDAGVKHERHVFDIFDNDFLSSLLLLLRNLLLSCILLS